MGDTETEVEVEETAVGENGPTEQPEAGSGAQDVATERSGPLASMESEEPDLEMPASDGSEEDA